MIRCACRVLMWPLCLDSKQYIVWPCLARRCKSEKSISFVRGMMPSVLFFLSGNSTRGGLWSGMSWRRVRVTVSPTLLAR